MKRWERPLLLFSLAINIAFVSVAATNLGRDRDAAPAAPERGGEWRRGERTIEVRHALRRERLGRTLRLDADQRLRWEAQFAHVAPALRAARERVGTARATYRDAVLRADVETARRATREISRAQAQVDSVCAEAMLAEATTLRPDQRRRYVQPPSRAARRTDALNHRKDRT